MKALEILKNASSIKGFSELQLIISKDKLDEAIKELEEYESDMDSYLDYTTGSRCTKSFNSCLGSIKIAYGKELEKIVKEDSQDRLVELEALEIENKSLVAPATGGAMWQFDTTSPENYLYAIPVNE